MNHHESRWTTPRYSLQHLFLAAALVALGMIVGANGVRPTFAQRSDIITTPQPQHMLSGGQLSVPILQDISQTLKDIDGRLSRMETLAKQMSSKR
jgi:hypothetical protein